VLLDGDEVAGYSFVWSVEDELHLLNFAVRPERQGRGLGRAFLRALIAEGRRAGFGLFTLEVRESNEPALGLYRSEGMVVLLKRRGYYQDTWEDALVMALPLQDFGEEDVR
jgi:ribosomal-protein-alanine N-acetyltransferase